MKKKWLILLLVLVVIVLLVILFLLLGKEKSFIITFDTNGGTELTELEVKDGEIIKLPEPPTKEGYVFDGWVDENGNSITKDSVISENITIKASWKKLYTCPENCTPIGDGSQCVKEVTTNMKTSTACPKGYALYDNLCLDITNQYHAKSIDTNPWWACNSADEYMYSQLDGAGGAYMWCAKKANKVTTKSCPNGYTESGSVCKKKETISCTVN